MWEFFLELLKTGGAAALVAAAAIAGGVVLWRENNKLREKLDSLQNTFRETLNTLQEKRVVDAREVTERVVTHVGNVDRTMAKLETELDVLLQLQRRNP